MNDKIDKPTGVHLAFDPVFNQEGETDSYQLYLLNGSEHKILFEVKVRTGSTARFSKFGPLPAGDKLQLTRVAYHWLNERLTLDLDVRAAVEGGTGPRHYQQLKIKPKQFFSSYREVPQLSRGAHLYTVFPRIDSSSVAERTTAPSLRELTRAQVKKQATTTAAPGLHLGPPPQMTRPPSTLQDRVAFADTLDLHLTALVDDPARIPKAEVLATQLRAFDQYIDQALRLDVKQVYIIHGVGDGVLKAAIHKRLETVPFVRKFHNSYHPRYGYGATEVLFES